MSRPITMPALSDTMSQGRLVRWVKRVGEPVRRGEHIADIETDKAIMEVEAFDAGYLAGPLAPENTEFPVGAVIGYVSDVPGASVAAGETPPPGTPKPPEHRLSPYARRRLQADAGAGGMMSPSPSPSGSSPGQAGAAKPGWPSAVRATVARNVVKSLAVPVFRVTAHLEAGSLRASARDSQRPLTLLFARAAALTAKAQPLFNARYTDEGLEFREEVNVGIAVDTPDGLVAPVLRNVAARSLDALAEDWRTLRAQALTRRLRLGDYEGASFYLSNLGTFEVVRSFDAILPVGAAALLCIGAIHDEHVNVTLVCDHRVVSGADAARFLTALSGWAVRSP